VYLILELLEHLYSQVSVSVKRLRTFLKNEELDPTIVQWRPERATGEEDIHTHTHTHTHTYTHTKITARE